MSERLTKALEFANYRLTLNNQIQALRAKIQTKLIHSINGGTFTITRELITFVESLIRQEYNDGVVLIDNFQNPIFLEDITSKYFEVTNDYHTEFVKLRKARKVHKLLDIEQDE